MAYPFTIASQAPQPQVVATIESTAGIPEGTGQDKLAAILSNMGELQLSQDGSKLLYYNHKRHIGGFAHKEVELVEMTLNPDLLSVDDGQVTEINGSEGGNYGKGSVEYLQTTDNQTQTTNTTLYYSENGVFKRTKTVNSQQIESSQNILTYDKQTQMTTTVPTDAYGDIRRKDGEVYIAGQKTIGLTGADGSTQTQLTSAGYSLAGALPTQPIRREEPSQLQTSYRLVGHKRYELTDHLGNVRVVISDRRMALDEKGPGNGNSPADGVIDEGSVEAEILAVYDYYPFGMNTPGRSFTSDQYRYGFQGQEKDDEIRGDGNSVNYKHRFHDSRVGRFFATDPLEGMFPYNSPYAFSENRVIDAVELEGLEMIKFGSTSVDFTGLTEEEIEVQLDKYYAYHQGHLDEDDILATDNDDQLWVIQDYKDFFNNSMATQITKYEAWFKGPNDSPMGLLKIESGMHRDISQVLYSLDNWLEGSSDGANLGTTTARDWKVGLAMVGIITGAGAIIEGSAGVIGWLVLVNNVDDLTTDENMESITVRLTDDEYKDITKALKLITGIKGLTKARIKSLDPDELNQLVGSLSYLISFSKSLIPAPGTDTPGMTVEESNTNSNTSTNESTGGNGGSGGNSGGTGSKSNSLPAKVIEI